MKLSDIKLHPLSAVLHSEIRDKLHAPSPREIHASGGGLVVVPTRATFVLLTTRLGDVSRCASQRRIQAVLTYLLTYLLTY